MTNDPAGQGPVHRVVRLGLAEALDAWGAAAYAEGREGRTHDTEGGAAQKALQDILDAHSAQLAAAVAAERERLRVLVEAVRDANFDAEDGDTFRLLRPGQERAWILLLAGLKGPNV